MGPAAPVTDPEPGRLPGPAAGGRSDCSAGLRHATRQVRQGTGSLRAAEGESPQGYRLALLSLAAGGGRSVSLGATAGLPRSRLAEPAPGRGAGHAEAKPR